MPRAIDYVSGLALSALALLVVGTGCRLAEPAGAEGSEGGACYGNGTCDDGFTCASDLCVRLPDGDEGEGEGEGDGEGEREPCRTVEGSVTIENSDDVAALADVCVVTGLLIVRANGLTDISLPVIASVGGSIFVGEINISEIFPVTNISLPVLASVGGSITVRDPAVTSISLPMLASVGGSINVSDNPALTSLSLPALLLLGGDLGVIGNTTLTSLSLPALTNVGGVISITGNPALNTCTGALIVNVGDCALRWTEDAPRVVVDGVEQFVDPVSCCAVNVGDLVEESLPFTCRDGSNGCICDEDTFKFMVEIGQC